jgi:hypothetical protein
MHSRALEHSAASTENEAHTSSFLLKFLTILNVHPYNHDNICHFEVLTPVNKEHCLLGCDTMQSGNVNDNICPINDIAASSNSEICFATTVGLEESGRKLLMSQQRVYTLID